MTAGMSPVFVAHNRDGMGERLRAILNAMVAAQHLGGSFKFTWPDLREPLRAAHAILPIEEFFSQEFITKHAISDEDLQALAPTPLASAARQDDWPKAVSVTQPHLSVQARAIFSDINLRDALPKTFAEIGMSDAMERARHAAMHATLPQNCAAIHLRAGDVIYGTYRTMDDFHGKVVSYPIAIALIKSLKSKGVIPLLMGQDGDLLNHLRDTYGVVSANDIDGQSDFTSAQRALFDMCLLGRCSRIFAGSSGFAVLGSWLAKCEIENPNRFFAPEAALAAIEEYVLREETSPLISNHQKAFAARAAFVLTNRTIATEDRYWTLLRTARDNDPENDFLQFVYACSLYEAHQHQNAEDILAMLFRKPPPERGRFMALLKAVNRNTGVRAGPYLEALEGHARSGNPMAALTCTVAFNALEETAKAQELFEIYKQQANSDQRNFPGNILPGNTYRLDT